MLGQEKVLGQLAPGFTADLLLMKANSLGNIACLDRPADNPLATLKDGRNVATPWSQLKLDMEGLPKLAQVTIDHNQRKNVDNADCYHLVM